MKCYETKSYSLDRVAHDQISFMVEIWFQIYSVRSVLNYIHPNVTNCFHLALPGFDLTQRKSDFFELQVRRTKEEF